ncbi:MAG: flagellar filament capping protein FliD [Phycisphaerae bacterium]
MGTISSGVGLVSGLDIQGLVNQLIAIDARPKDLLSRRVATIDGQRTALLDVSARISALLSRVNTLALRSTFTATKVNASDNNVLTATATGQPVTGSHSFIVRALAASQQVVSQGFRARDLPLPAGSLSIESAAARVNRQTRLEELNGYSGVQRGSFNITDGAGVTKTINLTDAATVQDVLDRVNSAGFGIHASLQGDAIKLTDSGGGTIQIQEVAGGHVASDLGFPATNSSATGSLVGGTLMYLASNTPSSALNDGLGIRAQNGGDFRISGGSATGQRFDFTVDLTSTLSTSTRIERLNHAVGASLGRIKITKSDQSFVEVDLTGLHTIGEIMSAIESAASGVTVTPVNGKLAVAYSDNRTGKLKIEDVTGHAARDLGITGDTETGKITGREILKVDSMADIVAAVNYAGGNDGSITAALAGDKLTISGTSSFQIAEVSNSKALGDLGLSAGSFGPANAAQGRRIVGGIDTVLLQTLNGGAGIQGGVIRLDVNGAIADVDLTGVTTLRGAIEAINAASQSANLGVTAGYDSTGTRLTVTSTNNGVVKVDDISGNMAAQLGIVATGASIRGANLQRRYVSENTLLSDLNAGRGVTLGKIKVTNSLGVTTSIDLTPGSPTTLGQILNRINASGSGVTAAINATGDGIALTDSAGGTSPMKVEDDGGVAARDLNIRGTATGTVLDGSYEFSLTLTGAETLDDVASLINARSNIVGATVVNDGNTVSPYRLSLAARSSGLAGELILDGGGAFDFTTVSAARDAQVVVGNQSGGLLVTSSTNTLNDVVPGLTLNLLGTSTSAVTVTVDRDTDTMFETVNGLVSAFNAVTSRIDELDSYNTSTETAGALFGDAAVRAVEGRLNRLMNSVLPGGVLRRLSQVGITLRNGTLSLDETKFRAAYDADPEAVTEFFANDAAGMAKKMQTELKKITDADGLIDRRNDTLDHEKTLLNKRISALDELLTRKRDRLTRQFLAMEQALSSLQSQQNTLGSLGVSAASTSSVTPRG